MTFVKALRSLDAQREACDAYIRSQAGEGWKPVRSRYDDGGYSGGTLNRPAHERLLEDIQAGKIETVVVYKVDRLNRPKRRSVPVASSGAAPTRLRLDTPDLLAKTPRKGAEFSANSRPGSTNPGDAD
jgi:hypothetical protein